jgi:hypothetical protein
LQSEQNVHSNEQMNAWRLSGGKSRRQRSQLAFMLNTGATAGASASLGDGPIGDKTAPYSPLSA